MVPVAAVFAPFQFRLNPLPFPGFDDGRVAVLHVVLGNLMDCQARATLFREKTSAGVRQPRHFLGLLFKRSTTKSTSP